MVSEASTLFDLFQKGGTLAGLVLSLCVIAWMYIDRNRVAEQCKKDTKEHFDARLFQFREVLEAFNRNEQVIRLLTVSVDARTSTLEELTKGFAKLVIDYEANRERWADRGAEWTGQLKDIRERIEELQRRPLCRGLQSGS